MTSQLPEVRSRLSVPIVSLLVLFFLSGFVALLYQVVWQRLLVFYTGSDTVSISLIVTAFMTGLGVGYLVGGRLADQSAPAVNLRYFVGAELGIMVFAAFSKFIFYDVLYASAPPFADVPALLYGIVFGVLLIPTFLMGISLPVLARAFRFNDLGGQARYISLLYFTNTLGAALGALLTGFFFVRQLGYDNAIWVGAVGNGICALGALALGRRWLTPRAGAAETTSVIAGPLRFTPALVNWSVQYALSGFAVLSLELIWFRILETLIKSVSLTFAVLLAIYLGSMAVGTAFGTWLCRAPGGTGLRPAAWRERVFLMAQTVLYGYTALSIGVFVKAIGRVPALRFLWDYFGSYEPDSNFRLTVFTYGVIPLFLLFVPTFLMGLSFSLSQSLIQNNDHEVGRKVGWLQFINIVGSAVGAWAVTWIGFPIFGTATLLKAIAALGLGYVIILVVRRYWRVIPAVGVALALVMAVRIVPANARFWQLLNGLERPDMFLFDENESAVSVIKLAPDLKTGTVFVNGLGQSVMPYRSDDVHTLLGALPVMIHPRPEHVAVIGLGSAGTLNGLAGRAETRRIDCFEIASNQARVLRNYAASAGDTAITAVLNDTRLRLIFRDGRYAIRNRMLYYDVIEADALRPTSAYSGNIYSREYFELIRSRLKPNGLAVTWCPTPRVLQTFRLVFPYIAYGDKLILIGSNQPIQLNWAAINQRARSAFSRRHYGRSGIDVQALISRYQPNMRLLPASSVELTEVNTDLFPKDEYGLKEPDGISF